MDSFINNVREQITDVAKTVSTSVTNISNVANAAIIAANNEHKNITCSSALDRNTCVNFVNTQNVKCAWNNDDKCVPCFGLNNTLCVEPCVFNNINNTCS